MMDPFVMAIIAAAKDPAGMGPMLDALGPNFSPERMVPLLHMAAAGGGAGGPPPAGTLGPGELAAANPPGAGGVDWTSPGMAGLFSGQGGTIAPTTVDTTNMAGAADIFRLLFPALAGAPPPGPGAPPPGPGTVPPTLTPPPRGITTPNVVRPPAVTPIMSGGVPGAQKAPELGIQASTGGTPAQLLLQMLLGPKGGAGAANPLRVPTLAALMGGAS